MTQTGLVQQESKSHVSDDVMPALYSLNQGRVSSLDEIAESHKPITIKGKRNDAVNDAVLVSREDWEAIAETIYLNNIPGMVESIKEASAEPLE